MQLHDHVAGRFTVKMSNSRLRLTHDLIDVIAINADKGMQFPTDQRRFDMRQDHRTQAFGTDVCPDRKSARIKQYLQRWHNGELSFGLIAQF